MRLGRLIALVALLVGCASSPDPVTPTPAPRTPWPSAPGPGRVDVAWSVARVGSTVVIEVRATVEAGWHIYGLTSEYGVHPALELELDPSAAPVGSLVEPAPVAELALDELPITAHRGTVTFAQALSVGAATRVPARFRWQVCNDPDTYCSPGASEVTLIVPGPDGRAPGSWEVAPGMTVELVSAPGLLRDVVHALQLSAPGGERPSIEVTPPPGVWTHAPMRFDIDDDDGEQLEGVLLGLDGPTGGSLTVRITHLGATRTVILPFVP